MVVLQAAQESGESLYIPHDMHFLKQLILLKLCSSKPVKSDNVQWVSGFLRITRHQGADASGGLCITAALL